ncbi:hypothetical protein BDV26DRAFT_257595 [Aspergillus bertholletiae]|uniref:Alpha and gamma adaptin binding protein p34-domain-containing protein n=1 Tax=Aspergillus bertholletiae TaxID=1226010 RepID=A0A5N7BEN9_9EURO|nr:hypothetical protein BDV26DRAFT_257595 [Aspergillus bertholletiae]
MPQQQQQQPEPTAIPNPRRLLILTPSQHSHTTIPPFLNSLTGSPVLNPPTSSPDQKHPSNDISTTTTTFAGYTTHPPLRLENRYYKAEVPIWVDEIPLEEPGTADPKSEPRSTTSPKEEEEEEQQQQQQQQQQELTPSEGEQQQQQQQQQESLSPRTWRREFSGAEAKVVRDAVGGVVICLRNLESPSLTATSGSGSVDVDVEDQAEWKGVRTFLEAVGSVKGVMDEERGGLGDVLGLVVLVGRERDSGIVVGAADAGSGDLDEVGGLEEEMFSVPWWEDKLFDLGLMGFEVVNWDPREVGCSEERDRFGEYRGMRRVREILETHDWASTPSGRADGAGDVEDELERHLLEDGFDMEVNELEREMVGLRFAIENGGDDLGGIDEDDEMKVESMEALMLRMKAIKDMSDELPESERKRFAAKAVRDIMMEL